MAESALQSAIKARDAARAAAQKSYDDARADADRAIADAKAAAEAAERAERDAEREARSGKGKQFNKAKDEAAAARARADAANARADKARDAAFEARTKIETAGAGEVERAQAQAERDAHVDMASKVTAALLGAGIAAAKAKAMGRDLSKGVRDINKLLPAADPRTPAGQAAIAKIDAKLTALKDTKAYSALARAKGFGIGAAVSLAATIPTQMLADSFRASGNENAAKIFDTLAVAERYAGSFLAAGAAYSGSQHLSGTPAGTAAQHAALNEAKAAVLAAQKVAAERVHNEKAAAKGDIATAKAKQLAKEARATKAEAARAIADADKAKRDATKSARAEVRRQKAAETKRREAEAKRAKELERAKKSGARVAAKQLAAKQAAEKVAAAAKSKQQAAVTRAVNSAVAKALAAHEANNAKGRRAVAAKPAMTARNTAIEAPRSVAPAAKPEPPKTAAKAAPQVSQSSVPSTKAPAGQTPKPPQIAAPKPLADLTAKLRTTTASLPKTPVARGGGKLGLALAIGAAVASQFMGSKDAAARSSVGTFERTYRSGPKAGTTETVRKN